MKKLILPLVALMFVQFNVADTPMTAEERMKAMEHLAMSKEKMLAAVKGLSKEQLNFKSSPESWSVAECAEHLAIAETNLFGMVEGCLKNPADPASRSDLKSSDDDLMKMITDRTNKIKTSEAFVPSGKFGSFEGTVKEFSAKRDAHIAYVKMTKDDLRNRVAKFPFGAMDAYQTIMFMSGHTLRHTAQMEEVKANPNFPKK